MAWKTPPPEVTQFLIGERQRRIEADFTRALINAHENVVPEILAPNDGSIAVEAAEALPQDETSLVKRAFTRGAAFMHRHFVDMTPEPQMTLKYHQENATKRMHNALLETALDKGSPLLDWQGNEVPLEPVPPVKQPPRELTEDEKRIQEFRKRYRG